MSKIDHASDSLTTFESPGDARDREAYAVAQIAATLHAEEYGAADAPACIDKSVTIAIKLLQESRRQLAATAQEQP